jgi:uncharacterized protein (DUF58 family)
MTVRLLLFCSMSTPLDDHRLRFAEKLELHAAKVVEGFISGLHKSPYQGFSVEFAEHRPYNSGESTRHMDWKLLARTDKYFVKRYEAETNLRCWCALDISASMRYPEREKLGFDQPNKLWFSAMASAAIIHLLKRQRDAFGLAMLGEKVELLTEGRLSSLHQRTIFNHLAELLTNTPAQPVRTDLSASLHELAERLPPRSMLVLFTDMLEPKEKLETLEAAFQHLRFKKHDLVVFHVLDQATELQFEIGHRPTRIVDMETGAELRIEPRQLRNIFTQRVQEFNQSMKEICGRSGADWNEADLAAGIPSVLLEFLKKRGRLF